MTDAEYGPNASNLALGDEVTIIPIDSDPRRAHVIFTLTNGDIGVESVESRERYFIHERAEGVTWARGHGDDVVAALLLTRSAA